MHTSTHLYGALVIMGVSGSGKSTIGRLLANRIGCPFVEGDDFHDASNIAKMRDGQALTDDDRWPWLDKLGEEMRIILSKDERAVLACSALKICYRERLSAILNASVAFVLLDADYGTLLTRLQRRTNHFMPPELLTSQLAALERPIDGERALILDATRPVSELCAAIERWIRLA